MSTLWRSIKFMVGSLLLLLGAVGVLSSLHAIADPKEAQQSNDADPFGVPPSFLHSITFLGVYSVVAAAGWLIVRRRRAQPGVQPDGEVPPI